MHIWTSWQVLGGHLSGLAVCKKGSDAVGSPEEGWSRIVVKTWPLNLLWTPTAGPKCLFGRERELANPPELAPPSPG